MSEKLQIVASTGDKCGEAATWDAEQGFLYWCDINRFVIHRMDHENRVRSWFFDEPVVALAMTETPGRLLVALGSRLIVWRPLDDSRQDHPFRLDAWPGARLNDGRAAPNGDFWVGSMGNHLGPNGEASGSDIGEKGVLYRVRADGQATEEKTGIGCSNTVCWSPDHRTFYFADSMRNVIWAYDYDPQSGAIANERPFFAGFDRGSPDGSAVDEQGRLWNCRFGGGCVVCVAPDGKIDRVVDLPVTHATTCAFGGPDLKTLFITTATIWTTESDRLAGSLFAIRTDVAGVDGSKARC